MARNSYVRIETIKQGSRMDTEHIAHSDLKLINEALYQYDFLVLDTKKSKKIIRLLERLKKLAR